MTAKKLLSGDHLYSTLVRDDNADDLLLPVPPIPLTSATKSIKKNGLREAISKSALNFIEEVVFTEVLTKMADDVKTKGKDVKISPLGVLDKVRQLGKFNDTFAAPKVR
jgi:hypothetical protein